MADVEFCAYRNRGWLIQKYSSERLPVKAIGKICGVSDCTICNWMKKFGIKARSLSEAHGGIQAGMQNPNYGKLMSDEQKEKIRKTKQGSKHTLETRKKMSESQKGAYQEGRRSPVWLGKTGDRCPAWKGGRTSEQIIIRMSLKYKEWRKAVFERDDYTCQGCGSRNGNGKAIKLHAHHILPFSENPDSRFDIDNGLTLCKSCHKGRHFK